MGRKGEEMMKQSKCCSKFLSSLRFLFVWVLITEQLKLEGASGYLALSRVSYSRLSQSLLGSNFDYKGWRLYNLPGQPVPVFHHSQNSKLLWGLDETACISICARCPSLAPSSLPPVRYLITCSIALVDCSNLQLDSNTAHSSCSTLPLSSLLQLPAPRHAESQT